MPLGLVLVVEDEPLIAALVEAVLAEAGYEVLVAATGREALTLLASPVQALSGLITDINLGTGPTGWDVADRARQLQPDVPVIYLTGDSEHQWRTRGGERSVLIAKPFRVEEVVSALASLINCGGAAS
ncbi:MAG TPA: response regulator [Caulobacteraceae bacterium]